MMRYIQLSDLAWYGSTFILELRECNGARKPVPLNQQRIDLQLRCGTYMKEVENCLENLGADIRAARVSMKWLWGVVNDSCCLARVRIVTSYYPQTIHR